MRGHFKNEQGRIYLHCRYFGEKLQSGEKSDKTNK